MKISSRAVLVSAAVSVILSACAAAGGPSTSLQVSMTDFAFTPNTLRVPAGEEIRIRVTNNGAVSHDLMIMRSGKELSSHDHVGSGSHADAYWEQNLLGPGESRESTFTAPSEPGEYQILCGVAGHLEAGMTGKLLVVETP